MADIGSSASPLIMVLDDDDDIRIVVSDILTLEGYRVRSFGDARAALNHLASQERPELILLDLMMPGMNGRDFRAEQLLNPALASIPVVVITASAVPAREIDLGVAVLPKPFTAEELLTAVRRHARPADGQNP